MKDLVLEGLLLAFRHVLRAPKIRLRGPSSEEGTAWWRPSSLTVLLLLLLSFYIVQSGTIYNILEKPPSVTMEMDPATGLQRPQAVMKRYGAQTITEGMTGGLFYMLGTLGVILIDQAPSLGSKMGFSRNMQLVAIGTGAVLFLGCYKMINVFVSIKLPNYLIYT
ncbi:Oligosaccharyltransferase complex subunit ostc [Porphyridium purpureum]|uniref:Oligosaccharyltransferase complex subunit ostc n=1 Tax=Porphyridium purpureum TaxID=35688 RepID=A0A5J4YZH6_PORPP|nr:Oligosaccharyltransferase complex subunit ostc [Porphyridium purpureum]|eukprot:POR5075..scf208_2